MNKPVIKLAVAMAVVGAGVLGAWSLLPAQQPKQTEDFMRIKLLRTQKVVEGLALEDFQLIAKNAQSLSLMSLESNWDVLQTVEYNKLSGEFRQSVDRLSRAAKEKNLDGATLAFFEVTLNCVRCHKYSRSAQ